MNLPIKVGAVDRGNEFLFITEYFKKNNNSILYIARDDREIFEIQDKITWNNPVTNIFLYRSWDQIPYDNVSPSKNIQSERLKTLYEINHNKKKIIVITSVNAILQKTVDSNFINENIITIFKNKKVKFEKFINKLNLLGYYRTNIVREKSEFAIRGSIIDIYLSNHKNPIRLDFNNDVIDSIKEFNRINQISFHEIDNKIIINPSNEIILNENSLNHFRKSFRKFFSDYRSSEIYQQISEGILPIGAENYLPLFHRNLSNLFDYCKKFHIILNNDFQNLLDIRLENINDFYRARLEIGNKFNLEPKRIFLNKKILNKLFDDFTIISLSEFKLENEINFNSKKIYNISSIKKEINFNLINHFFKINNNKNIVICTLSKGSLIRIKKILFENINLSFKEINNFKDLNNRTKLYITVLKIDESLEYNNLIFINEKSLFGYNLSIKKKTNTNKNIFFEEINKLTKNSILVHSEYGFCRFLNIKKLDINDSLHDCIELEFADEQKLFIPVENLNYITKYGNDNDKNIQLDKLGTSHWQKRKALAKNKIKNTAKKIMSLAAKRFNSKSYLFKYDHILYEKFCSTFQFIETDDQIKAIDDVRSDFSKNIPTDRLIVGDVAFGKTEVIIRASFLAAKSKIQTIILVPTTLLSRQHFINFSTRLNPFGIKVSEISRLISSKNKQKTILSLENGDIDIVIGTHALLNKKLKFKKLGLIIYDEEQKFGTRQKEVLKSISPKAHVISLSATPIPRTLSLALSGIRELSLILTAPYERLSVRSFITPFDEITIIEAIKREIYGRKNSVFIVTPRKKDIPFIEEFINRHLPNIKFITAHGKLKPNILEERITKFYNKEIPIMISTNIIENGLDLPHVNTIVVYKSNLFSLSGIYQLKGRVGRSNKRGYAYLTYNEKDINDNSRKRLNIINSSDEIGSGFNIASQDLELRGAGSIIGEEQSGFVKEVGTELYYQMLEDEIYIQKKENNLYSKKVFNHKQKFQPIIKIPEKIFIPDDYINDVDIKMSIYKRISLINNNQDNNNLIFELINRFGNLPQEVENLFKLIEIKILCLKYNIENIDFGKKGILFSFYQNKPNNRDRILEIALSKDNNFIIRSDQKIFYNFNKKIYSNKFKLLKKILMFISV